MRWERKITGFGKGSKGMIFPKDMVDDMGLGVDDIMVLDYDDKKKEIVIRKK